MMTGITSGTGSASCRFAHYFVVCGLDTKTGLEPEEQAGESFEQSPIRRSFKSKVLAHYPESTERRPFNRDAVNMLCMPRGLSFRTQTDDRVPFFHSFTVSQDDGTRFYGFVQTYYEEVTSAQITMAMQTLHQMHRVEHHSSSSSTSSSASSPSTSSMDSLVNSLDESDADSLAERPLSACPCCATGFFQSAQDTLYASKALCLLTPLPFLQASRHFLTQLHQAVAASDAPPLPLESYIHNILYEVPVPPPGRSLRFHGVQGPIMCQQPGQEELPLGDYPLGEAFSLLGVENLVRLLTSVLLESQVLLLSNDYQRLMTVAESISTLLFPFQWWHIYLPVLPASLHHLLDAPVPFIIGIQRRDASAQRSTMDLSHEANLCFVDIDNHHVDLPEDLPLFPDQLELIQELNEVLLRFGLQTHAGATITNKPDPAAPPCLSSLVLEDLMEDRRNGNLGREQLAVLERLQALARRCGGTAGGKTLGRAFEEEEEELKEAKMNVQLREVFAGRFATLFGRYEEFVIHSAPDLESWLSNREGVSNFDKGSFLSTQPTQHLHFLSRFLETAMFSSFVDSKVLSRWADRDPIQRVFDRRLEKDRLYDTFEDDPGNRRYRKCAVLHESAQAVERRLLKADHTAIHPHLLDMRIGQGRHHQGCFPRLQADVLAQGHNTTKWSGRNARRSDPRKPVTSPETTSGLDNDLREKYSPGRRSLRQSKLLDPSPSAVTQTKRGFVDGLLRECRLKTRRMLMERMGKERAESSQVEAGITGLQENTLIHSICVLLERTWAHGLKMKQKRSALWSHLLHYQANEEKAEPGSPAESPVSGGSDSRRLRDGLPPPKGSFAQEIRFVQTMNESLSEVGRARAWVYLALEKKLLSQHLKLLLTNQDLLRQLYKPHAFLLCEEEREQFLFHLLSLNTVDYFCFTRTFTSISIPYRVVIMPMKKLSIAMAMSNPWVCVSGELGDSGIRQIPKNTQEIYFHCQNLGRLSTLQLGQENSGLLAKCLVDCVIVHNEITGHTYRFPCGRWLGKGVGDGSLERVLIGQLVSPGGEEDSGRWAGTPPEQGSPPQIGLTGGLGSLGRCSSHNRLSSVQVQEEIREAVNNLVKHFHKAEPERGNLTALLCGEVGLVRSLEQLLLHGFKSSRLFQRSVFIWDFVEKAVVSMETADQMGDLQGSTELCDSMCHYVNAINATSRNIGKEGKFQLWVCLGVRDQLLSLWLPLLAESHLAARLYEETALFRDRAAVHSLSRLLHTLREFPIALETALVKGVDL
ncbi:DENN domain-containing protein 5B [Esox lucius]|uniref:DENN domain containing 5B n=2 Tax=Esox lucius TaxID=8010 RepID=A0A3P8XFD1_ESOLU|nr:DENN domain-containing protein 5B [Esox lucius]